MRGWESLAARAGAVQVNHVNTGVTHLELCGPYTRVHCLNSPPHLVATKTDTESGIARLRSG